MSALHIKPADDDIFLPKDLIAAFVAMEKAWRDGPSWRLSKERRLWPLTDDIRAGEKNCSLGMHVRLFIPAWAEKHAATDHASTSDHIVIGWIAGKDENGTILVDVEGTIWADLDGAQLSSVNPNVPFD